MTLAELVTSVLLKATGKVTSLSATDTKYVKVKNIANYYIESWQNTPDVDWSSLYDPENEIGTVTATDTFDLDDAIRKISDTRGDYVRIGTGDIDKYEVVPADTLQRYDPSARVCAQVGRTLKFRSAFTSDHPLIGSAIYVPIYTYAETLSSPSNEVPVDIPEWLVLMCAAEYVRNDVTKQNQYPSIVAEANELLQRMIDDNDGQANDAYVDFTINGRSW